jgi:hypothetical protein
MAVRETFPLIAAYFLSLPHKWAIKGYIVARCGTKTMADLRHILSFSTVLHVSINL